MLTALLIALAVIFGANALAALALLVLFGVSWIVASQHTGPRW